jgi:hydroxyethylthiazole kinase
MGLAGEIAYKKIKEQNLGTSSYRTFIIDSISNMTYDILKGGAKIESI